MFQLSFRTTIPVALFMLLSLTGCVSTMQRPATSTAGPTSIHAVSFVPSEWDLPLGANVVPESNLVVRKSPNISNGAAFGAMLFGPLGVAALDSSLSSDTEEAVKGMDSFAALELPKMTTELLQETHQNGEMPSALNFGGNIANSPYYELQPFMYLETDGVQRSDLMLVLRINQGEGKWTGQYISHIFGISEISRIRYSEEFREAVRTALKEALLIFYQDIRGQLVKAEQKIVPSVSKSMMFAQGPLWGWELSSPNKDRFLFHARANPGSLFGGVHIFDALDVTTKPF